MANSSSLKNISLKQLEHEINKRKKEKLSELETEKTRIEEKIRSLSGATIGTIETLNPKTTKFPHAKNEKPAKDGKLKKSMHKARVPSDKSLRTRLTNIASDGKEHPTADFISSLEKDGWKTTSEKPYYVVAAGLASLEKSGSLRRVSKGVYQKVA